MPSSRPFDIARDAALSAALRASDVAREAALRDYGNFLRAGASPAGLVASLGPAAALRAARHAMRRVPAYQDFLKHHGWVDDPRLLPAQRMRLLPTTDKDGYVRRYPTELRCLDGAIPMNGTQIDESSGSSGIPYNWVRCPEELDDKQREVSHFTRMVCGENLITLNGFSMGAWATGVNVGEALRRNGVVKSTGPDVDKILHTLDFFGPRYTYLITGYPPFLKQLLDVADERRFDWEQFRLYALAGGEGLSEALRDYLQRRFRAVYSGYGASDLDIGVAGEMPFTVWLRRQALQNADLKRALFGDDPRLPMIFQYNPLDYWVEVQPDGDVPGDGGAAVCGDLVITICRLSLLSPRIRYNIRDAGGVIPFPQARAILRDFGLEPSMPAMPGKPVFQFPLLFLFGRSDSTISYMGANIYPQDVEHALYADEVDARRVAAFALELVPAGDGGEDRPCVHVEVVEGPVEDEALATRVRDRVVNHLMQASRDFRTSVAENPRAADVQVRLHPRNGGPFAANTGRIKRKYFVGK